MTEIISIRGMDILQKDYQQLVIRGSGDEQFNQITNKYLSLQPPTKNLEIIENKKFLLAKSSFDQWNLIFLEKREHKEIISLVSNLNANEEVLASDYSYGQVYFEISGDKKEVYLNRLTHFDLRSKKFPVSSMGQTLIARIDCSIYNLENRYIISCNKSFEDYFKDRLLDSIDS